MNDNLYICFLHEYICQHSDWRERHTARHFLPLPDPSLCVVADMNDKKPEQSFQLLMACGNTESLIVNIKYSKYKLLSLLWL